MLSARLRQVSGNGEGEEAHRCSAGRSRAWAGVKATPQGAGAQAGPGSLPGCGACPGVDLHGGAVVPEEATRWGGPASRLHGWMFGISCGASPPTGARRARNSAGAGIPGNPDRSALGPCAERRPLARGRRTEAGSGENREEGRWSPGTARHVRAAGAAPPGAGAERRARGPGSYLPGSRG